MYICPKCGKYMTWYMKYYCGVPFGGWKCGCGYDTNLWSNTITTNRAICYGERKTEQPEREDE